jgi:hypothetical protein
MYVSLSLSLSLSLPLSLYVLRLATSQSCDEVGRNEFKANFVCLPGNPLKILAVTHLAGSTINVFR